MNAPTSPFETVSVDRVRDYWNRQPCNLKHSPALVGTREYFDQVEARKYFVEPHIPGFAEFPRWKGKRVLEIGCGLGTESINFARAGADLTIVELSSASLALCKKRFEVYGQTAEFFEGNAEQIAEILPDRKFDLIFSFGVIHHTPHPEQVVRQLPGLLAPDGELRIMLYSKISFKLFWIMRETNDWDFSRMDEIIARHSEAQTGCPVTYTYTFDEIRTLLREFEILDIHKDHIFPYDIDAYRRYEYIKDSSWRNVSNERFRQLEQELGWHTLVRARATQRA